MGLVARYRRGEKLSRGDDELDALPAGALAAVSAASGTEAASQPEKNAEREKPQRERVARETTAREEAARRKAEAERLAREQAEAERRAREQAERERVARRKEQPVRENAPAKRPSMPSPVASARVAVQGAGAEISGPLLRAVVKADTTELTPGEQVEYLVTLLNVGGRRAEGVALRLMFPDGAYEPVDFARSGFRNEGGGALVLDDVAIDSGQALEYPVVFRVRNDAVIGQELRCSVRLLNGAIGTWDSYRSRASFVRAPRRP